VTPQALSEKSNGYEWDARWRKANAVAALLYANDFPSADIDHITEAQWEAVAKQADVQPPHSQETIDCIADCLRKLENRDRRAAAVVQPEDPLEGLPRA
jgi:hypothetical protein